MHPKGLRTEKKIARSVMRNLSLAGHPRAHNNFIGRINFKSDLTDSRHEALPSERTLISSKFMNDCFKEALLRVCKNVHLDKGAAIITPL
jgi:hypothetical protein